MCERVGVSSSTHIAFDQMPPELRELLAPGIEGEGYLGEFFQRAAHQPQALAAFHTWTTELEQALSPRIVAAIGLTVGAHTGNRYEQVQHECRALAQQMTPEEVRALERMRAGSCPTFSDEEVAAAALARCLLEDCGRGCEAALLRLSRLIGEAATTACLMLAARYAALATMANAWNLRPPIASPLDAPAAD